MKEVELSEGLLEIGGDAFSFCKSLKHINLPTTMRNIGERAFSGTNSLPTINLPDAIDSLGEYAFLHGGLLTFRIPPLITTIPQGMVEQAKSLFTVELSESVTHLESRAFKECHSLRNLAIPSTVSVETLMYDVFRHCTDLELLFGSTEPMFRFIGNSFIFGSDERIINELKHRFDNLPIHKMLYYQSFNNVTSDQLNNATNMRSGQRRSLRSKLDPTGKQNKIVWG